MSAREEQFVIWEGAKNANKPAVRGSAGFLTFNESNFVRPDTHAGFQQKQKNIQNHFLFFYLDIKISHRSSALVEQLQIK